MANNLNNKIITQIQANFVEAALLYVPKLTRVGRFESGPAGTVKVGKRASGGIAVTLTDAATSATTSDMHSFEAEFTTLERYVKHTVPSHRMQTEKGLIGVINDLGQVAGKNIDREFFSMTEGLFAAAHPRASNNAGCVGAGKKALDTGLKGLVGETGEFTFDTLLATASLSETSLNALVELLIKQRDDRGLQMSIGQTSKLAVICAAKNVKTAIELTKSTLSGSDMATNYLNTMFGGGVVQWEFTDDDDYMVVDGDNSPFGYYLGREPSVEVRESDDGLFTHFVVKYHGVPVYDPYLYGVVACNVA